MAHSPPVKAEAITALLSGESAHRVARRLQLPRSTVIRWRRQVEQIATNGPQKKHLSEQVEELVNVGLDSLRAQTQTMSDEQWLLQQPARDLALLYGVMFDNTDRLLRAMGPVVVDVRD